MHCCNTIAKHRTFGYGVLAQNLISTSVKQALLHTSADTVPVFCAIKTQAHTLSEAQQQLSLLSQALLHPYIDISIDSMGLPESVSTFNGHIDTVLRRVNLTAVHALSFEHIQNAHAPKLLGKKNIGVLFVEVWYQNAMPDVTRALGSYDFLLVGAKWLQHVCWHI